MAATTAAVAVTTTTAAKTTETTTAATNSATQETTETVSVCKMVAATATTANWEQDQEMATPQHRSRKTSS